MNKNRTMRTGKLLQDGIISLPAETSEKILRLLRTPPICHTPHRNSPFFTPLLLPHNEYPARAHKNMVIPCVCKKCVQSFLYQPGPVCTSYKKLGFELFEVGRGGEPLVPPLPPMVLGRRTEPEGMAEEGMVRVSPITPQKTISSLDRRDFMEFSSHKFLPPRPPHWKSTKTTHDPPCQSPPSPPSHLFSFHRRDLQTST